MLDRRNTKMMTLGALKGGFQFQIRYDGMYKRSKPKEIKTLTMVIAKDNTGDDPS
jgi:hypothetical protein